MASRDMPSGWLIDFDSEWGSQNERLSRSTSLHGDHGGYDLELADLEESAADELMCFVCSKLLREPHLTLCCGQHCCKTCLDRWMAKKTDTNSCPHCRTTPFQHVLDKSIKRKVEAIKVHSPVQVLYLIAHHILQLYIYSYLFVYIAAMT